MVERTSYPSGAPSWVDLSTTDVDAARTFYGPLFGWTFEVDPTAPESGYNIAHLRTKSVAGLLATMSAGQPSSWNVYFATDDVSRLAEAVTENGATVTVAPLTVSSAGSMMFFADPAGAMAGGWQPDEHIGAQLVNEPGALAWTELVTPDVAASADFYAAALGVEVNVMSDDPGFQYRTLRVGGDDVAGLYQADGESARWTVYFAVEYTDSTVQRAIALGATVTTPAKDSPYGRFAGLTDPQGAGFYVLQLKLRE